MADKNIKSEERRIDKILCELFQGRDAAIEKYARVRHTQWEMNLWYKYGLPLKEVDGVAKNYFGKRFLNGVGINSATKEELAEAFERLAHAVKDGCHGRCFNLVVELNAALGKLGIDMISNPEQFLDWLTFDYETKPDDWGNPAVEKPYGFEIRIFHDAENRKDFWNELLPLLKVGKVLSMTDTFRFVREKRKRAKSFL
ncbi:hypothetical protein IKF57_00410 [Candidatus Saccharibacteria bacterium]|nr:hypothetical protein [Candidatus Saccharibacteria bacterium]